MPKTIGLGNMGGHAHSGVSAQASNKASAIVIRIHISFLEVELPAPV